MKMKLLFLAPLAAFAIGCSTTGQFRLPANTTLKVTDRTVTPDASGKWETSPFFWSEAGGAKYRLYDGSGKMLRQGKLKTQFRVASIFWPPFALIYWPMGLHKGEFDLTRPGDGYMVQDEAMTAGMNDAPAPMATTPAPAPTEASAGPAKKTTKKK